MSDQEQDKLGRFLLKAELGRGGFSTVYLALDPNLDREVALKVLHPSLLNDPAFTHRFRREAKALATLHHPKIVTIYEVNEADGRLFIVMELAHGPSLAKYIVEHKALPWKEVQALVKPICEALDYAHAQGIVHRDLKPANIMIDKNRGALLTDFGLARLLATSSESVSMTMSGGILGTPAYIAPEVWEMETAGPAADIYALGCIIYEMLTGQLLFSGGTPMHIMRAHDKGPQFPSPWPDGVPQGISDVLQKALARQPEERYPSAGSLWQALEDIDADARADTERAQQAAVAKQWRTETQQAIAEGEWSAARMAVGRWLAVTPNDPAAVAARALIEKRQAESARPPFQPQQRTAEKAAREEPSRQEVVRQEVAKQVKAEPAMEKPRQEKEKEQKTGPEKRPVVSEEHPVMAVTGSVTAARAIPASAAPANVANRKGIFIGAGVLVLVVILGILAISGVLFKIPASAAAPESTVAAVSVENTATSEPALPTDTAAPVPTDTTAPIATDISVPVATDTPQSVPTDTVAPAPSNTPSTANAQAASVSLPAFPMGSTLIRSDDFTNSNSGWLTEFSGMKTVTYLNGHYDIENKRDITYTENNVAAGTRQDVILIIEANVIKSATRPNGGYGLMCRVQTSKSNFFDYVFKVTSDNHYAIVLDGIQDIVLASGSIPPEILNKSPFTLQASCIGNDLRIGVNGYQLAEYVDNKLSSGLTGLWVSGDIHVAFDNFVMNKP